MKTYWLQGRADMGEANDSMVCMWVPKKKKKTASKVAPLTEESPTSVEIKKREDSDFNVDNTTTTAPADNVLIVNEITSSTSRDISSDEKTIPADSDSARATTDQNEEQAKMTNSTKTKIIDVQEFVLNTLDGSLA